MFMLGWILLVLGVLGVLVNGPVYIRIKMAARRVRRESSNGSDGVLQAMVPVSEYHGGLLALSLVFVTVGLFLLLQ